MQPQDQQEHLEKAKKLNDLGQGPYALSFQTSHHAASLQAEYVDLPKSKIVVLSSLTSFEKRLPANKFLRIHKSYVINLDKIDNISSTSVEIESEFIPVSRNKKPDLDKFLESK